GTGLIAKLGDRGELVGGVTPALAVVGHAGKDVGNALASTEEYLVANQKKSEEIVTDLKKATKALSNKAVIYFGAGKNEVPAGTTEKLMGVVEAIKADPVAKVVLSGYHDTSGSAATNEEIAKARAKNVKALLLMAGVPEDQIILRRPQVM
ncbi:MAG: OmpA family protein, partial [Glaciimonas sp.]|nr:OmpA family protein [Glaciimonas sp.]